MSMGEADSKFPGQQGMAEPPSPSRENPGQVYPKSNPDAAPPGTVPGGLQDASPERYIGNPYLQRRIFDKLDQSLSDAIATIEGEQSEMGGSPDEVALINKFKRWRDELTEIISGKHLASDGRGRAAPTDGVPAEKGGLFDD